MLGWFKFNTFPTKVFSIVLKIETLFLIPGSSLRWLFWLLTLNRWICLAYRMKNEMPSENLFHTRLAFIPILQLPKSLDLHVLQSRAAANSQTLEKLSVRKLYNFFGTNSRSIFSFFIQLQTSCVAGSSMINHWFIAMKHWHKIDAPLWVQGRGLPK